MEFGWEAAFPGTAGLNMPGSSADNCLPEYSNQAIWATEDDYRAWNRDATAESLSNSSYDGGHSHTQPGREPPNKKSRNSQGDSQGNSHNRDQDLPSGNRSNTIGRMFFKTKLCCRFRAGTCPYITNCNFAHGNEELRKPPPNWKEIVAAQDGDRVLLEPRERHPIPSLSSSSMSGETQRSYKGRHCKKFYTEEGCPYGDACTFLHDKQSKARESVAISLGPTARNGYGGNNSNLKPLIGQTRTCNKWEATGYCPFGNKCRFAHGSQELHKNQGGLVETEGRDSSSAPPDSKQVVALSKTPTNTVTLSSTPVLHSDVHHTAVNSQRSTGAPWRRGQSPRLKWKGPDKISRVYGDWIDDIE